MNSNNNNSNPLLGDVAWNSTMPTGMTSNMNMLMMNSVLPTSLPWGPLQPSTTATTTTTTLSSDDVHNNTTNTTVVVVDDPNDNNIAATTSAIISNQADAYAEQGIVGPWSISSANLFGDIAALASSESAMGGNHRKLPPSQGNAKMKPKRPLSAYNIFFKEERNRILDGIPDSEAKHTPRTRKRKTTPHGKIGFENLAKAIGER